MGPHFLAQSAKIAVLYSFFGLPGILQRIQRIQRKRNMPGRTDPGFPTPGAKMTVVYTNSLKLYTVDYIVSIYVFIQCRKHIYIYIY